MFCRGFSRNGLRGQLRSSIYSKFIHSRFILFMKLLLKVTTSIKISNPIFLCDDDNCMSSFMSLSDFFIKCLSRKLIKQA